MTQPVGQPPELTNPDHCRCGGVGRVIDSRSRNGYRQRRHCCQACGRRWNSYQTTIHPKRLHISPTTSSMFASKQP